MTSRDRVNRAAYRAGRRPVSRAARADLDAALTELEALTVEVIAQGPPERADAYLRDLDRLADDLARVVRI